MLMEIVKSIYQKINSGGVHGGRREEVPLDQQRKFVASFPEPKDDFERSFFKYQCFCQYCYNEKKWMLAIYNLGALVLYPFVYGMLKSRGASKKKSDRVCDAVLENVPRLRNYDVIPDELTENLHEVQEIESLDYLNGYLTANAVEICKTLRKRYFWHFYFRMIVTIKLALFNMYLYEYNPKKIAFYSVEREFSGPLQTLLCEKEGSEYISYMHGDYLYAMCFAFQRYSHYYTWDKAYNDMFVSLRCKFPMTVYQPKKLRGIAEKKDIHECEYFATYYFSAETRECAEVIRAAFRKFEQKGLRCKIRPHPRFSDIEMLKEVFDGVHIEDPIHYSLADSITDSWYTVGLNTTVISQAYFSGKEVVIDDISMPKEYAQLKDKGYIMLDRPHRLLSQVAESVEEQCVYDNTYLFCCLE